MDFSDENLNPLYCAIGKVVCAWASIESFLDFLVLLIFHQFKGKEFAYKQEIPRSLDNKLKYLIKAFNRIELLVPLKDTSMPILECISILSVKRHILIHGVLTNINFEGYDFIKREYGKDFHDIHDLIIRIVDINLLENMSLGLITQLVQLLGLVVTIHLKQEEYFSK
jgi:hypothetical protein